MVAGRSRDVLGVAAGEAAAGKMADGKAGEEKPEKPQRAGAAGGPEEEAEKPVKTKTVSSSNGGENSSRSAEKRSAEDETADLPTKPTKISKFGFAIGSQTTKKASAISIKLGSSPKEPVPTLAPKTLSVAAAFNEDEDSEPEEMPPEAKMRMKNIGRYKEMAFTHLAVSFPPLNLDWIHQHQQDQIPSIKESMGFLITRSYGSEI
ncbi:PEST proteolytic signal-containing nuclear protein isoform X2 [Bubalus kerabau]|uniref:PEST proteolytic signal-containing nuclear protein isoform X2 n=1 Tax=Bubalus carabanensis TaxID=3119969 RepID=UPI00244ED20D|nr:PEST proteolytic signal-containing nuclear protein isoform X2 [Bubalus carabanensis]